MIPINTKNIPKIIKPIAKPFVASDTKTLSVAPAVALLVGIIICVGVTEMFGVAETVSVTVGDNVITGVTEPVGSVVTAGVTLCVGAGVRTGGFVGTGVTGIAVGAKIL